MSYFDLDKIAQEQKDSLSEKEKQEAERNARLNEYKKNIFQTFNLFLDMLKEYPKICQIRNVEPVSYIMRSTTKPKLWGREETIYKQSGPFYAMHVNPTLGNNHYPPGFDSHLAVDNSGLLYLARGNYTEINRNKSIYYTFDLFDKSMLEQSFSSNAHPSWLRFIETKPSGYYIQAERCYGEPSNSSGDRRPYLLFLLSLATYRAFSYSFWHYDSVEIKKFDNMSESEKEAYVVRGMNEGDVAFRELKSENDKIESLKTILLQLAR